MKNKDLKSKTKDLLSNIKLLSFIPVSKIKLFYRMIKEKYFEENKSFFNYFEKYYNLCLY